MRFSLSKDIESARKTFQHLNNDGLPTSIGDVWSIKKILLLNYYMPVFSKIVLNPKNNFKKCYFADPFCGSGIFSDFKDSELKHEKFPGSSLIGALNASKWNYTDCLFSEENLENINALNSRLAKSVSILNGKKYSAKQLEFKDAVQNILEIKKYQVAILILIDPDGYAAIKWKLMDNLFKQVGVDIILNFYTHRIAQNVSASKKKNENEQNLNEFFGDENWKKIRDNRRNTSNLGSKLLKHYLEKIRNKHPEKMAVAIGVYKNGDNKLYDLILITRSKGGANVMKKAKEVMEKTTTEAILREFKTQIGRQTRLFDD